MRALHSEETSETEEPRFIPQKMKSVSPASPSQQDPNFDLDHANRDLFV